MWRRQPDSNWWIAVLQTAALPLGYAAQKRPLQNTPFCPIPASGSNFNPQNTPCIPACPVGPADRTGVVKIFTFLGLEQNWAFFKGLQKKMERETGFEPATSTLARSHSTTELFPLNYMGFINIFSDFVKKKLFLKKTSGLYKIVRTWPDSQYQSQP